jgi:ribose transport system substrate-binding protein
MAQMLQKRPNASKKVGVLKCMPGHVYAVRRGEGFTKRIEQLGFKVVSTLCANDVRDQGYRVAQDMMTANPDIAGIFCENDPMALGAVQAVRDAGKSAIDDVLVVGFNADAEAIEAIKAGYMAATIQQTPYEMGKKCVELADRLLKGEALTFTDPQSREITIPVRLITQENVSQYFPAAPSPN